MSIQKHDIKNGQQRYLIRINYKDSFNRWKYRNKVFAGSLRDAKAMETEMRRTLSKQKSSSEYTITDACEDLIEYKGNLESKYEQGLRYAARLLAEKEPVIDRWNLQSFTAFRLELRSKTIVKANGTVKNLPRSARTVNRLSRELCLMIRHSYRQGKLGHKPDFLEWEPFKVIESDGVRFDLKNLQVIFEGVDERAVLLVWFLLATGCRVDLSP